ncbi:MAG: DinB family protein [Fimbriimonas sp.]|nr:DinB family protein [Fimbriimonas sp.]
MRIDDLVEAWRVNDKINLELLGLCAAEHLEFKPGKGKTIRSNYVHLIGFRTHWLAEKMPAEAATIPKLDWKTATREEITEGLQLSGTLMETRFRAMDAADKPGRQDVLNFFAYCIAHEANHRAQIEIALRLNGAEPEDKLLYRLWEWSRK